EALRQALQAYLEHRGSARLAALAGERLDELLATLASRPDGTRPEREDVYRLFGACRFGFHEALVSWRDNQDARAGLTRAIVAVAEYELGTDDPRAAIALLSELDDAPGDLLTRARAAADDQARRQADLERLGAQHDKSIGTRTRMFVGGVLGTLFTTVPLIAALRPGTVALQTHAEFVAWAAGLLVVILGLGFWARDSMTRTLVNRRIFATGVIVFVAQMGFVLGAWRLGVALVQTQVLVMALWALSAMMVALAIDHRLTAAAIGYAAGFAAACLWPEHRFFAMSGGNLVFTINAVWHWRPAQLRLTDEERAALRRRRGAPR
ncbi:MAG: hypothetical protein KC464_14840, partial [Myxococcales bacterium]|nr:hypothetical protein [Myxococcales bacterium]